MKDEAIHRLLQSESNREEQSRQQEILKAEVGRLKTEATRWQNQFLQTNIASTSQQSRNHTTRPPAYLFTPPPELPCVDARQTARNGNLTMDHQAIASSIPMGLPTTEATPENDPADLVRMRERLNAMFNHISSLIIYATKDGNWKFTVFDLQTQLVEAFIMRVMHPSMHQKSFRQMYTRIFNNGKT